MSEELVLSIVDAIARADSRPAHDLEYSLHDYVDTDAIEALHRHRSTDWELFFSVPAHDIRVTGRGEIFIDGVRAEPGELLNV